MKNTDVAWIVKTATTNESNEPIVLLCHTNPNYGYHYCHLTDNYTDIVDIVDDAYELFEGINDDAFITIFNSAELHKYKDICQEINERRKTNET